MKISFIIKTVARWLDRKHALYIAFLAFLMLHAVPALASQEAPSSRSGSVLNILLLGCLAYFLVRSFRRRSGGNDKPRPGSWTRPDDDEGDDAKQSERSAGKPTDRHDAARQAWSVLSSDGSKPTIVRPVPVPADAFNEAEFLEGAKLFFSRFQQARDSHELQDLRGFISDEVYSDAVAEAQHNPVQEDTETKLLNVRLMDMKAEGGQTFTTVFYDAQIRKGAPGEQPVHVRAVWEFSRNDTASNALWVLEKINKVDQ